MRICAREVKASIVCVSLTPDIKLFMKMYMLAPKVTPSNATIVCLIFVVKWTLAIFRFVVLMVLFWCQDQVAFVQSCRDLRPLQRAYSYLDTMFLPCVFDDHKAVVHQTVAG